MISMKYNFSNTIFITQKCVKHPVAKFNKTKKCWCFFFHSCIDALTQMYLLHLKPTLHLLYIHDFKKMISYSWDCNVNPISSHHKNQPNCSPITLLTIQQRSYHNKDLSWNILIACGRTGGPHNEECRHASRHGRCLHMLLSLSKM